MLEANGKFVCRVDAHSDIPNNYISKLLDDYFNIMQFDDSVVGVGGVLTNSYKTKFGSIVADFYASKFGVGNSPFRCVDKNNRLKKQIQLSLLYIIKMCFLMLDFLMKY